LADGCVGHRTTLGTIVRLTAEDGPTSGPRIVPLFYDEIDRTLFIVASSGVRPGEPQWLLNVRNNPIIEVRAGHNQFIATAGIRSRSERAVEWLALIAS
jgi:hypothetical protein